MQCLALLFCLMMMLLHTGCAADAQNENAYPELVSAADSAALTEMLLKTDMAVRLSVNDDAAYHPDVWIRSAVQSRMLARTMLQSVTWRRTGDYLTVQAYYGKPQDALRQDKRMLENIAKQWSLAYVGESDAVRVLIAHDFICRTCTYTNDSLDCHSAIGALLSHRAACDGYAEAFALLMEYAEIPTMIVTGKAVDANGESEAHAWNLVQLFGVWYHIDCTWNDTGAVPAHTYFLCDDNAMRLTHQWDAKLYPTAHGGSYRYEVIVADMAERIRTDSGKYTEYNPVQDSDS